MVVIPTLLSGESAVVMGSPEKPCPKGAPSMVLPAKLPGETPYNRFSAEAIVKEQLPKETTIGIAPALSTGAPSWLHLSAGVDGLTAAIAEGEAAGLSDEELASARVALALEERRIAGIANLERVMAQESPAVEALQEAIREAELAGLDHEVLPNANPTNCARTHALTGAAAKELLFKASALLQQGKRKEGARAHLDQAVKLRLGGDIKPKDKRKEAAKTEALPQIQSWQPSLPVVADVAPMPPSSLPTEDPFPPPPGQPFPIKPVKEALWNRRLASPRRRMSAIHVQKEGFRQKARILYL